MKRDKLQSKEQEINKLKEDEKSLLNIIDDLQKEKNKWIEKYNDLGQDFDQLKHKEQECEELKKANEGILTTIRILAKNNIRLREILSEIKELAEENIRIADLEELNGIYRRGLAKQILQKISEI